jgi:putative membrane protein
MKLFHSVLSVLFSSVVVSAALVGTAACGGDKPEARSADPLPVETPPPADTNPTMQPATVPPADTTEPPPASGVNGTPGAQNTPPPAPAPTLTDAQIAAITNAANTGEIEAAKLAQKKGKSPRVKKFAAMMIAHHTDAKQQQAKLMTKLKVKPEETPKSEAMTNEDKETLKALQGLGAGEFDSVYIAGQVDAHKKVLDTIDTQLIPNIKDPEFKAALVEFRPKVEMHLNEAKAINQEISGTSSPPAASNAGPATNGRAPTANK